MRVSRLLLLVLPSLLVLPLTAPAQTAATLSSAATAATAVPPLIPYSGQIQGFSGHATATFLIYKDETGGEPLFAETQTVLLDSGGHYQVQLGATLTSGLPTDLFASGEARWLEVQVAGEAPRPRVLLVSVPYALKAADAATLGGLPASAFALRGAGVAGGVTADSGAASPPAALSSTVTTPGGTSGYLPVFTGAATIGDSIVFQNSNGIGINDIPFAALDVTGKTVIRGNLDLGRTGNPTTATGFPTYPLTFHPGVYSTSINAAVYPVFQWQAEPVGNNTANPSATFNLLTAPNSSSTPSETGFHLNLNGTMTFAPGQTFPGAGGGTITGVTAGTGLTGGGTTGAVTLNVDTTKVPLLGSPNNFTGNQSVTGNITTTGSETAQGPGSFGISGSASTGLSGIGTVNGVYGQATGTATFTAGVAGNDLATTGWVFGVSGGVVSSTDNAAGVNGYAASTTGQVYGVFGSTPSSATGAAGVSGFNKAVTGSVYGVSGGTNSPSGVGVFGSNNSTTGGTGVQGYANATSGYAVGVSGGTGSPGGVGVSASNTSTTGGFGIFASTSATSGQSTAIQGQAPDTTGLNFGVQGTAGVNGIGVQGQSPNVGVAGVNQVCGQSGCNYVSGTAGQFVTGAGGTILQGLVGPSFKSVFYVDSSGDGYFAGNLNVTGKVSKGSGSFKIDDPLDPANRYLSHSFVESPDMMNVYNGNITTDKRGMATVELPEYFGALNRDFRYQLTVMGQFAQAIVAKKIANNRFVIRTSKPNVEVSWQVTGIRHDAYANANRIPVEESKPEGERGYYLHPEVFGQPSAKGIVAAHRTDGPTATVAALAAAAKP